MHRMLFRPLTASPALTVLGESCRFAWWLASKLPAHWLRANFAPKASSDRSRASAKNSPGVSVCVYVYGDGNANGDWLSAPCLEIAPGMANHTKRRVKHDSTSICL